MGASLALDSSGDCTATLLTLRRDTGTLPRDHTRCVENSEIANSSQQLPPMLPTLQGSGSSSGPLPFEAGSHWVGHQAHQHCFCRARGTAQAPGGALTL